MEALAAPDNGFKKVPSCSKTQMFMTVRTHPPKDLYVFESWKTGVKPNKTRVHVCLYQVVSFSLLEEIMDF